MVRNRLFLAAALLGGAFWFGSAGIAQAAPPVRVVPYRQPVIVNRSVPNRMPGWDWRRTYPYSSYNAWRNPYWYYPYTPYVTPTYYYPVGPMPTIYGDFNTPPVPPLPQLPPLN